jgi:hypothetical protein
VHLSRLFWAVLLQVGLDLVRESGVDPAAQAGACTVSAGVGGAGGDVDVQEEKGEEEVEEGLRVDFNEDQGYFCKMVGVRPIWTVRASDPTAAKSGRRGHARRRSFVARIIFRDMDE